MLSCEYDALNETVLIHSLELTTIFRKCLGKIQGHIVAYLFEPVLKWAHDAAQFMLCSADVFEIGGRC